MIRKFFAILFFLFCCSIDSLQGNEWYSEYWQKFLWRMWKNDSFDVSTYTKIETGNHFKQIRLIQISEQLAYHVTKDFSLEIHYSYIHGRTVIPDSIWNWQHRLELEGNRTFRLPWNHFINTRNRFEIRKLQNEPKIQYRLRQLTMYEIPIKNAGILTAFSVYNELFYDLSTHQFTQDRIYPCQFTLSFTDKISLNLFLLIRLFRSDEAWHRSAVLGTQLSF